VTAERSPLYYWDYLQLDRILGSQRPESAATGEAAHDELLFIVVHQAFELWFKQILHELDSVLALMGRERVPEKDVGVAVARLGRVVEIERLLVAQLDVLETMTPLDFLDFRDALVPASGFQSVQFRLIENKLGLHVADRLKIKGAAYTDVLNAEHAATVAASEREPTLRDHVERWLERTPFLHFGDFDFWTAYRDAVERMLARDREIVAAHPNLDEEERAVQLAMQESTAETFAVLFDAERYGALRASGQRWLSRDAVLAALLINLYRDEPMFQLPFQFLTRLVDVDEGLATWRYRHALMVHRMIGGRIGTGGTSGHAYLEATARRHRVFGDLFDLPTFFIPRSSLPVLPREVAEQLDFRFGGAA
jgi:tryptophan 2,3-dioxygenase